MLFCYQGDKSMQDMKPIKVKVSLSLDEEVVKRLRIIAEEDDRRLSSCINLILRDYLRSLDNK